MEDVLGVYHRPYNPLHPVVCFDERPKLLRGTPRGVLSARPGRALRQDYEYERTGSCNVFLWVEPLVGRREVHVTARRTSVDFADQLRRLSDQVYPQAEQIVLVVDNLNTHTPAALYERFSPAEASRLAARFEWHYTPEHGSWLNMAECELSVLSRQCLARRLSTIEDVTRETASWQARRSQRRSTIRWQFTTDDARTKLRRLYPEIIGHN